MDGLTKKHHLEQLRGCVLEMGSIMRTSEEIRAWGEARSVRYTLAASRGGAMSDRVGQSAVTLADLDGEMDKAMIGLPEKIAAANDIIADVADSIDRAILRIHYAEGKSWEETGTEVGYTAMQCIRRRDQAIGLKDVSKC